MIFFYEERFDSTTLALLPSSTWGAIFARVVDYLEVGYKSKKGRTELVQIQKSNSMNHFRPVNTLQLANAFGNLLLLLVFMISTA